MKSGFIAIIGRPNAGKSSLLNTILNKKIAITTPMAQTTRNSILGILNEENLQIVFIDTPGIHEAITNLGNYMNKEAYAQAEGVDVIYYIIDGKKGIQVSDKRIIDRLMIYNIPIFLLVNKIDDMGNNLLIQRLSYASDNYDFAEIIPISCLQKENIDELLKTTMKYLNDDVLYYPEKQDSNLSIEFILAEIIREKVILNTREEIPHLIAVKIEELEEKNKKVYISANIICGKQSHKAIVIGKSGSKLKKINDASSMEIEKIFNKKVILSLYVSVEEDWLNKDKLLFEYGYFSGDKNE